MHEHLYEALPDTAAYLARIGLKGAQLKADIESLDRLVRAQLTHISFENLEPWGRGACPDLGIRALFEKIVSGHRGGYCFELNSLFCALLKALGFDCYKVIAHVLGGREELGPPAHCAIICCIDGQKHVVDVGYGGPVPYGCLSLSGESRFGFHVEREGMYFKLMNEKSGDTEIIFKDVTADEVELVPLNFFISQSPTSPFRNELHLNLRLPEGSVSVVDHELKFRSGDERWERNIDSAELPEIMERYFHIRTDSVAFREIGPFPGNVE